MRKQHKQGLSFTLVELLVVISIIAILASLLLPALRKAKKSTETIVCKNNINQVVKGEMMYAADYDGVANAYGNFCSSISQMVWWYWLNGGHPIDPGFKNILPKIIADRDTFVCPSETPYKYKSDYNVYGKIYAGVNSSAGTFWSDSVYAGQHISEWMKIYKFDFGKYGLFYHYHNVKNPSRLPLYADTTRSTPGQFYYFNPGWYSEGAAVHCRHNGGANVGFVDGHVATLRTEKLAEVSIRYSYSASYSKQSHY